MGAIRTKKGRILILPVMVLVTKKTAVLRMAQLCRISVMTMLTDADAGNQDIGSVFTAEHLYVTGLAIEAGMRVMAEDRLRQPDRFNVCGRYLSKRA